MELCLGALYPLKLFDDIRRLKGYRIFRTLHQPTNTRWTRNMSMKKKRKRHIKVSDLGLPESVTRLFPKTSSVARPTPSRWNTRVPEVSVPNSAPRPASFGSF